MRVHWFLSLSSMMYFQRMWMISTGWLTPWLARLSTKTFSFCLTSCGTMLLREERCFTMSIVTMANLQCFITFFGCVPFWLLLAIVMDKRESPSTITKTLLRQMRICNPCSSVVDTTSLLVASSSTPWKMWRISPLSLWMMPPSPTGRGLPLEAPSKFNL